MWIMTTFGFFSVVEKPEDRGRPYLTVRARSKVDLVELLKRAYLKTRPRIIDDTRGDYRYRVKIPRNIIARVISDAITNIDYSNFKNEVKARQGAKREDIYHNVWLDLSMIQPTRPFMPMQRTNGTIR